MCHTGFRGTPISYMANGNRLPPHQLLNSAIQKEFKYETSEEYASNRSLCLSSLQFYISPGKEGTIVFDTGPEEQIYKDKNGQLTVVSGWAWGEVGSAQH